MGGLEQTSLPGDVQRATAQDHAHLVKMIEGACRAAQQLANVLGAEGGQVTQNIIFRRLSGHAAVRESPVDRRVDEAKVAALDGSLGRADAAFVKERTALSRGRAASVAHTLPPETRADHEALRFDVLWATAGNPYAVFALDPDDLQGLTGAPLVDVVVGSEFSALPGREPAPPKFENMNDAIKPIAARAQLLCAAGYFDQNSDEDVPSPCISVCRMSEDRSHCIGCFRSIPEIKAWSQADRAQRLAIWSQLSQRADVPFPPEAVEQAAQQG